MPSLDELSASAGTPLANALEAGLRDTSYNRTVSFTKYRRAVLPVDGFVFWVITDDTREVPGSLHITTGSELSEDQSYDQSTVILTTSQEIHAFHDRALDEVWVGDAKGVRFAISSRASRYDQAGLFHYLGGTIRPAFASQFIDDPTLFDAMGPVTSSSLALFLAMPATPSVALNWCPWPPDVPLFPSFAVPDNQPTPYIAIHHDPAGGKAQTMSALDPATGSTSRIVCEKVRLRLYGLTHQQAENIVSYILHWALLHPETIGITNSPHIRDEKQAMAEINALAMCKTLEFDVMYPQAAVRNTALALIHRVVPSLSHPLTRTP